MRPNITNIMKSGSATILIVDDEPSNRKLLQSLLDSQGYRTTTAANGELALASIKADPPDLILLDVMMPGANGYQVAAALKADAVTASIPIIMVSALADREARVRGLNAGAEDFLSKPVDKEELWMRVRNLLRLKHLSELQGRSAVLEQEVLARTADLHKLAHYDALTSLPNRATLIGTLRTALPLAVSNGWTVAVMFIDVDHFKAVNDTLGHAAGDALLAQFSGRLVESVRDRDTVGRLSGDEFALIALLESDRQQGAHVVATKVLQALQTPFDLQGHQTRISASIGITIFPDDGKDADRLLRNADIAMYRAKAAGRNAFRFFNPTKDGQAAARPRAEVPARKAAESTDVWAPNLLDAMDAPTCTVDETGSITAINHAWRLVESDSAAVPQQVQLGTSYLDMIAVHHEGDPHKPATGIRQLLRGDVDRFEFGYTHTRDDQQRWFNLVASHASDGMGAVISHYDVTDDRRAAATLTFQDSYDALTQLPNRQRLLDLLGEALTSGAPDHAPVAVACIAVDGLKNINESYGYAAGDELIQAISARVSTKLRTDDTLARFAGDEFVVIWPGVSPNDDAAELARRLMVVFATPFQLAAGAVTISASIGITLHSGSQSAEDLLLAASAAMRVAKRQGPGRASVYTSQVQQAAQSRIRVEADIRAGIERGEFVLHYQPIVDLQQRVVTGVEALVRWNHPDGLRMPDTFIPIAEQSGLIVPLGAWIMGEACRQAAAWSTEGLDLTMAVNVSVPQIADPELLHMVAAVLKHTQLPARRLMLEITESTVLEDAELALAALVGLHDLGAGIAIDDFGTGYGSLLYLKRYPIHTLKIDRSFVAGIGINADDDAIVASVVSLASAVNAVCTAEGVETSVQAEALRALGCNFAQGYHFARPVAANELPSTVEDCRLQLRPVPVS